MNRFLNLKSFIVHGEAEYYQNVVVVFVKGESPVLTIFEDGEEIEQINLLPYNDKDELHALMQEKGFQLKPYLEDKVDELRAQNDAKMEAETKRKEEAFENRRRERQEQRKRVLEEKEKQKEATKRAAQDGVSEETAQKARAEL